VQQLTEVLGWLHAGLSDNDDLVAAQSKLEELANWLSESRLLKNEDADEASLGELLTELRANLRPKDKKAFAKRTQDVIDGLDAFEALTRSASYDAEYVSADPQFKEAAEFWEELVGLLDDLETRKILDKLPQGGSE
jgi:hypothetical protein